MERKGFISTRVIPQELTAYYHQIPPDNTGVKSSKSSSGPQRSSRVANLSKGIRKTTPKKANQTKSSSKKISDFFEKK